MRSRLLTTFVLKVTCELQTNEPGLIVADGDFVVVHGRFSGFGLPVDWIAADILRIEDGNLVEHWDVIQDEAMQEQSKSRNPMFGDEFPTYRRIAGM